MKKWIAWLIIVVLLLPMAAQAAETPDDSQSIGSVENIEGSETPETGDGTETPDEDAPVGTPKVPGYKEYQASNAGKPVPNANSVVITADQCTEMTDAHVEGNYNGYEGPVVVAGKESSVTFTFSVEVAGMYRISLDYYPIANSSNAIERRMLLDGVLPFSELETLVFERIWKDESDFLVDSNGNESRPSQIEEYGWYHKAIVDSEGYYTDPFAFYLTAGEHTLTLESVREPMAIGNITVEANKPLPTYEEARAGYTFPEATGAQIVQRIEAEYALLKSDVMLYPTWDRSSPDTYPMSYSSIKLNTIGGEQWKMPGQWVEWEIIVPADGLYKLSARVLQNVTGGLVVGRRLMIDGNVPFAEASNISIPYKSGWQQITFGDEDGAWLFELSEGKHTIRLEAVLGDMGEIIRDTEDAILRLNEVYRQIIVITGTTPDTYRNYHLDDELPEVIVAMTELAEELDRISARLTEIFGEKSEQNSLLDSLADRLERVVEKPRLIASTLASIKTNISSLGTWALGLRDQPLRIDNISLSHVDAEEERADASFFGKLWHELKLFVYAFFTDYNSIGDQQEGEEALTVWVTVSREQATIIQQLIQRHYVTKTGQGVNMQLVAGGSLLPSILSGSAPDVMLGVASTEVMNYAARGAIASLEGFADREVLAESFYDSAIIPLEYEGELFALPQSQTFPMLFYRKDVFEGLGLELPKTWQGLYDNVLHTLSQNNMEFGIAGGLASYAIFLFQSGGEFYLNDGKECALSEEVNINTFREFANLYTSYGMPIAFDFANRFRTGEMPIGIADYSMYNQLVVFAPEIKGQWEMVPVFGKETEDGLNISVPGTVVGAVVMEDSEMKQEAWDFLVWWTGAEAQALYAREQESLMGSAARYTVANKKALESIAWTASQMEHLKTQWEATVGIPEVPGGYYLTRYIDFAFKAVVLQKEDVRETMYEYTDTINKEIIKKRKEFKLDLGKEG